MINFYVYLVNIEIPVIANDCIQHTILVDTSHRGDNMQSDKSCPVVEQYLAYLITMKESSRNTIVEYRLDLLQFFRHVALTMQIESTNFQFADIDFICSIQLTDMYAFIAYYQEVLGSAAGTRCRKIISIRQFWKYLKTVKVYGNQV